MTFIIWRWWLIKLCKKLSARIVFQNILRSSPKTTRIFKWTFNCRLFICIKNVIFIEHTKSFSSLHLVVMLLLTESHLIILRIWCLFPLSSGMRSSTKRPALIFIYGHTLSIFLCSRWNSLSISYPLFPKHNSSLSFTKSFAIDRWFRFAHYTIELIEVITAVFLLVISFFIWRIYGAPVVFPFNDRRLFQ